MRANTFPAISDEAITIRPASWRDTLAMYHLEKICFPMDYWPIWDVFLVLTLPTVVRLKAVDGEKMIGFLMAEKKLFQDLAWIATFAVAPNYRRQGIGTALMQTGEQRLDVERVRLSVRENNEAAIQLYRGFGYQVVNTWPRYYRGGANALIMEKSIAKK